MNTSSFPNCFYCYLFKKYKVFCACLYCKGTLFTNFNRSLTPWVPEHVNKLYSLSRIEHLCNIKSFVHRVSFWFHSQIVTDSVEDCAKDTESDVSSGDGTDIYLH